ncbi:MAG: hypothetical protein ACK5MV_03995 [Aminipila sp.]
MKKRYIKITIDKVKDNKALYFICSIIIGTAIFTGHTVWEMFH